MRKFGKAHFLMLFVIFSSSCQTTKTAKISLLCDLHKTIAIIPPEVEYEDSDTPGFLDDNGLQESFYLQESIFLHLKDKVRYENIDLKVVSPTEVNQRLEENGFYSNGSDLTSLDLCEILEVDAILETSFFYVRPASGSEIIEDIGLNILSSFFNGVFIGGRRLGNIVFAEAWLFDKTLNDDLWSKNFDRSRPNHKKFSHQDLSEYIIIEMVEKIPYR